MSFTFQPPAVADVSIASINPDPEPLSFPAAAASTPMKRRREAMSADAIADGAAPGGSAGTSTGRRRTRSWRGDQAQHQHRVDTHGEAMDIEEEGPQRKRVARR